MELQVCEHKNGKAPLIGWSSSSLSPTIVSSPKNPEHKIGDENSNTKSDGDPVAISLIGERFVNFDEDASVTTKLNLSENENEEEEEGNGPKIPDGGWGWVVVFASLVLSMIADGVSFSFGLLYVEFLHEFGQSKSATSWIGSVFMAVPLLTGPIMSAFVDRYGCRLMTIVGGLISASGFIMSAHVNSVGLLYLTFGFIGGLGLGLCFVTAVVSIAFWFDKKRTFAIGWGACGTGVGTFLYSPMTNYFISEYGWRGTVLLLAGTFLNMCVCGCLMREPEWWTEAQSKQNSVGKLSKKSSISGSVSGKSCIEDFPDLNELRTILKTGKNHEYLLQTLATSFESPKSPTERKILHRSDINLPSFVKQNEKVPLEVLEKLSANSRLYNVILENYPSLLYCRSTSDKALNKIGTDNGACTTRVPVTTFSMKLKKADQVPEDTKKEKKIVHQKSLPNENYEPLLPVRKTSFDHTFVRPLPRQDSVPWLMKQLGMTTHNHFKNIKLHKNSVMYRGAMLNIHKYRLRASSCPNIYRNSMVTIVREEEYWYDDVLDLFKGMADFSMFLELHFLLMSLSTILLYVWFIVPYFYLIDAMLLENYTDSEGSLIISIIGITNTIGMIGLGWIGDKPWVNVTKTYGWCLILCGLCCAGLYVFMNTYYMLVIVAACFGLSFASTFSFTPGILVELIALERFPTAYGLILLCQGIGNLIGPPVAGMLFDVTGKWEQSFLQAGLWIAVSGVLILLIPITRNRKIWGTGPLEKEISEKGSVA